MRKEQTGKHRSRAVADFAQQPDDVDHPLYLLFATEVILDLVSVCEISRLWSHHCVAVSVVLTSMVIHILKIS